MKLINWFLLMRVQLIGAQLIVGEPGPYVAGKQHARPFSVVGDGEYFMVVVYWHSDIVSLDTRSFLLYA